MMYYLYTYNYKLSFAIRNTIKFSSAFLFNFNYKIEKQIENMIVYYLLVTCIN